MSELSEIFPRPFIMGLRRIFGIIKISKMLRASIFVKLSKPFLAALAPRDALETTGIIAIFSFIAGILLMRACSEIFTAVIQSVVIAMIHFFVGNAIKNQSVHSDMLARTGREIYSAGIKSFPYGVPFREPVPPGQPFKIFQVHDCILSLREGNKSERLIEWLGNRVALHAIASSGHVRTSNANVLLSHFIISA